MLVAERRKEVGSRSEKRRSVKVKRIYGGKIFYRKEEVFLHA